MIYIVTDSTAYLTKSEAEELYVKVAPVGYYVNGNTYSETYSDCNGDFNKIIEQGGENNKTFHTNNSVFADIFSKLIKSGHQVLCFTLSSRLSGTYSSACIAAKEVEQDKIRVIDSLSTAGVMYFLIKKARQLINSGKSLSETADEIEKLRDNAGIVFSVDDISPLRKSGRMGIVKRSVNTVLNQKPILTLIEGSVVALIVSRGSVEQIMRLRENIPIDADEIAVHYAYDSVLVDKFIGVLKEYCPKANITKRVLGPVLTVHLGCGLLGASWIKYE
jgi:DegV family protein with EDD domain